MRHNCTVLVRGVAQDMPKREVVLIFKRFLHS
jgi:hypothetical protein